MIRYHLDADLSALSFVVEGDFSLPKYQSLMKELISLEYDRTTTNFLWDLRKINPASLSSSDIMGAAALSKPVLNSHGDNWRSALVVDSDLQFGLARMVEAFINAKSSAELSVFRSMGEARTWLYENRRNLSAPVL